MSALDKNNTNPCGMCRALGLKSCKGHGGGPAGDGENSEEQENIAETTLQNKPSLELIQALSSELMQNPQWEKTGNNMFSFTPSPDAALENIYLDFQDLELTIKPKKDLSPEESKDLNTLFQAIMLQAKQLGGDAYINNHGELEISMQNMQQFASLTTNLMSQNLLPIKNVEVQANFDVSARQSEQTQNEEYTSSVVEWPPRPSYMPPPSGGDDGGGSSGGGGE